MNLHPSQKVCTLHYELLKYMYTCYSVLVIIQSTFLVIVYMHLLVSDGRLLSESMRQLRLTQEHEDFELKKALLCLLITLGSDSAAAVQVSRSPLAIVEVSGVYCND